jgi:hypothetical protein
MEVPAFNVAQSKIFTSITFWPIQRAALQILKKISNCYA